MKLGGIIASFWLLINNVGILIYFILSIFENLNYKHALNENLINYSFVNGNNYEILYTALKYFNWK